MAGILNLRHRQNAIAVLVIIAVIFTILLMIVLPADTKNEHIVYGTIVCTLWMIPSVLYYMLILNYKKAIKTDIIPKIAVASTTAMQSMMDGNTYSSKQQDIIRTAIIKTAIGTTVKENQHTQQDEIDILDDLKTLMHKNKQAGPIIDTINISPSETRDRDDEILRITAESKVLELLHKLV